MVGRSTSQPRLPLVKGTRSGLRSGCLVTGRSIILTTFWALDLLSFPWTDEGRTGIPACPERQAGYVFKRPFGVAGFQPAVSRVSNPQTLRRLQSLGTEDGSADWKSAIQQVGNLRHVQRALNRYTASAVGLSVDGIQSRVAAKESSSRERLSDSVTSPDGLAEKRSSFCEGERLQ